MHGLQAKPSLYPAHFGSHKSFFGIPNIRKSNHTRRKASFDLI
jgi:hypothetical protein